MFRGIVLRCVFPVPFLFSPSWAAAFASAIITVPFCDVVADTDRTCLHNLGVNTSKIQLASNLGIYKCHHVSAKPIDKFCTDTMGYSSDLNDSFSQRESCSDGQVFQAEIKST